MRLQTNDYCHRTDAFEEDKNENDNNTYVFEFGQTNNSIHGAHNLQRAHF